VGVKMWMMMMMITKSQWMKLQICQVKMKWKENLLLLLKKNWGNRMHWRNRMKSYKDRLYWWTLTMTHKTNNLMCQWMNISIWILLPMFIKSDLTWRRHKIDITRWHLSYKLSWMRSKLSVMRLSSNLKSWREVWHRMQCLVGLERKYQRRYWMNGKKWILWKTKKCISTDCKTLHLETDLLIKKRYWRKKSN
jgi:hypothetical protein